MTSVERLYTLYNAIDDAKDKAGEVRLARARVWVRAGATPYRVGSIIVAINHISSTSLCFLVYWGPRCDGFVFQGQGSCVIFCILLV